MGCRVTVYKDMAHDAGYRGDEAERMARAIEEQHQREEFYRQLAAEAEADAMAALGQELDLQELVEAAAAEDNSQTE